MTNKRYGAHSVVTVSASKKYDILIGRKLIERSGEIIKDIMITPCKIAVITDDTVDKLYAEKVVASLKANGFETVKFVFAHGEESKCFKTYEQIVLFLAEHGLTRTDAVVAVGGGVVGDITGFASATFLRGIKYFQIPTTLLAQIDSSVGGKTAIDIPQGKNLVGAFCQPQAVICDTETLDSLPERIFKDGMGETAKYAVLDKKIYALISKGDYSMEELVRLCVDYKRMIVEADEFDKGMRSLLNLGHTPAHGIERLSGYTIPHGMAVAMGLKIILRASAKHGMISEESCSALLEAVTACVGSLESPYGIKEVCEASLTDKKRSGNFISPVMVYGVGDCRINKIRVEDLTEYLS